MKRIFFNLLFIILAGSVLAQVDPSAVRIDSDGNEMMPFATGKVGAYVYYDDVFLSTLPKELVGLYEKKFASLVAAFSRHNNLNPPKGFEVQINQRIEVWTKRSVPEFFFPDNEPRPVGSLEISFAPLFRIDNRPQADFHISSQFYIHLNNPYEIAGTPLMADIYPCPVKIGDFHGYPIYKTNRFEVTILNFTRQPVFIPVSQQEFIQTTIAYWQHKIAGDQADKTEYQQHTGSQKLAQEQQQRRQEFERAYQELLKYDKSAAEELKKTFAAIENTNPLDALDETGLTGSQVMDNSMAFARMQIARLRDELSAMSEAEKQRQAYYSIDAFQDYNNASGLLPLAQKTAGDALVRINPDLVADHPDRIQLASIHWFLMDSELSDRPRHYQASDQPGSITDNQMVSLYHDTAYWQRLVQLLKE